MHDVIVVGAGLGGLSAAYDLANAGADAVVLEARGRVGGRVEHEILPDGRPLELGGEVVGAAHVAYLGLAADLGMEIESSYQAEPGEQGYDLLEGPVIGDAWMEDADRAGIDRFDAEVRRIAGQLDPAAPWSHPDAARLDALSMGQLLRDQGATAGAYRCLQMRILGASYWGLEHQSVLAAARAAAAAKGAPWHDYEAWESLKLVDGSGALPRRLAQELGDRIRLEAVVTRIEVGSPCAVELATGERLTAGAVICAIPVGPLRSVQIDGLSQPRLASLLRLRHAPAAKAGIAYDTPVWRASGCNGLIEGERDLGTVWVQRPAANTMSALVPPERLWLFVQAPEPVRDEMVLDALSRMLGEDAARPAAIRWRFWGTDPYTLGYVPHWAPGELTAIGPLHGTHEPPFYVAGSDHWVAGYMEGAVATGRAAAKAALS
ncbi:MAG: monoamine oxidase [Gaiellales bacterium]|nr:monoamine oxidase [Gaiellales bacterium]